MKENKHIDRLFQEKFRDFETNPSDRVWTHIEKALHPEKRKRRPVFWMWFGSVAAGLALLLYITNPFSITTQPEKHTTEAKQKKETIITQDKIQTETPKVVKEDQTLAETPKTSKTHLGKTISKTRNTQQINPKAKTSSQFLSHNHSKQTPKNEKFSTPKSAGKMAVLQKLPEATPTPKASKPVVNHKFVAANKEKNTPPNQAVHKDKKTLIKEIKDPLDAAELAQDNTDSNILKKSKTKKWSVSTFAAPVYLNSFDKNTSSIDKQFDNNAKQGSFSSAYGVQLAYQFSNKLSVQSGVHLVDYGYKTYDIYVAPSGAVNHASNIDYNSDANLVAVSAAPANIQNTNETNLRGRRGNLMQVFGYVEVPLELKYRINRGDFNINVVGGFSTLLLNKNEIFIETGGLSSEIGAASNLNSLNFSGNVGLEFDYKLYQNLHFNMVPMFKVQTNTFAKNTGGFSPYAIGVYSGLNFRF